MKGEAVRVGLYYFHVGGGRFGGGCGSQWRLSMVMNSHRTRAFHKMGAVEPLGFQ